MGPTTNNHLSLWLETSEKDADAAGSGADDTLGSHSLNELADLVECFELLERVWPTEPEPLTYATAGDVIGCYTLTQEIGRGGMGSVWEAQQYQPIRRRLALKLIHANDADRVARRFKAERHLLARMDHPNIARILDAGSTDQGLPWFAMELIEGTDILAFCQSRALCLDERLTLFLELCDAIEHAHQKGVIHRDLKPSNVMIDLKDGQPLVKVIDFGLARTLDRDLEITAQTRTGAILGSLCHMSPEQTIAGAEADTRTDVYLLGSLLYQLLTGELVVQRDTLHSGDLAKILIAIREDHPPRPSERIVRPDDTADFGDTKENVMPRIRGELDWIAMRAIEKDPDLRYQSVEQLAADVRRFLSNEPVEARPTTAWYATQKYVRRNTAFVTAVGTVLVAVIAVAIFSTVGFLQVSKANALAERRLSQANSSNAILSGIFSDLDFDSTEATTTPLRIQLAKRLIRASEDLKAQSIGDSAEVAQLQSRLGTTLNSLGFHREAAPVCQIAYETATQLDWPSPRVRDAGRQLAWAWMHSGRFEDAHELLIRLCDQCESESATIESLTTQHLLAKLHYLEGRLELAEQITNRVADLREELLGAKHLDTLESRVLLATIYTAMKDGGSAVPILEACVAEYRATDPRQPRTIQAISDLAHAYGQTRQRERGVALADEAFELARTTFGEFHEVTFNAQVQVGLTAWTVGEMDRAEQSLTEAIRGLRTTRLAESRSTFIAAQVLARLYSRNGYPETALPIVQENLQIAKRKFPPGHTSLSAVRNEIAILHGILGDLTKTRSICTEIIDTDQTSEAFAAQRILARSYFEEQRFSEAAQILEASQESAERMQGRAGRDSMLARVDLAKTLSAMQRGEQAIALLESYLKELDSGAGLRQIRKTIVTAQLGISLAQSDELDRGIELMERIVANGAPLKQRDDLVRELRRAYLLAGQTQRLAESCRQELEEIDRGFRTGSPFKAAQLLALGLDLIEFGQFKLAEEALSFSDRIYQANQDDSWQAAFTSLLAQRCLLAIEEDDDATSDSRLASLDAAFARADRSAVFPAHAADLQQVADDVADLLEQRGLESAFWRDRGAVKNR
ncbi:MAG: tetratricopeptide repeat protein [Planctomycetota bacterium]